LSRIGVWAFVLSVTREEEQVFWFDVRLQVAVQTSWPGFGAGDSARPAESGLA
jgi:hypothetical protein